MLYGVTPEVADFYTRADARQIFYVVLQRIEVSQVGKIDLELVVINGAVAPALCAKSRSLPLGKLPEFETSCTK